ncbi:MAG: tyrosine-type recombinase/integrase [Chloroflexota bacterium]|nr:tyrosine-type recombinase/integrase [Chloroflexota bacterium]
MVLRAIIHEADVAKTARQNRLSHIRKLLELLAIGHGHYRQHYNAVKSFLRVQANDGDKSRAERVKRTLNPHEATALLGAWRNDTSDVGRRNDVMISLLVYADLRRSELIALRWSDINFEDMTITVRRGKGDKERVVAIVDPSEGTVQALQSLRHAQGGSYTHVFPSMTRERTATWAADTPTVDQTAMRVVSQTAKRAPQ